MSPWLMVLFGATLATGAGAADLPPASAGVSPAGTNAVEAEYQKVQADDDAAQNEVERWLKENTAAKGRGGGASETELDRRIRERFAPVDQAYKDFLQRHPDHARAHLAYGCFLNDRQDELGAQAQWEKALALDPTNPDVYNNLAGRYTESGPVNKAFAFYTKAIDLKPAEPLYYYNFASALYVLRNRARSYYGLDEGQVFAKIIGLYSNAARLEPSNFTYSLDLAQTYYSLKPFPPEPALSAWSNTLLRAHNQVEREEVFIHLARVKMLAGQLNEARALVSLVTNAEHAVLKSNLLHNISRRETPEPKAP